MHKYNTFDLKNINENSRIVNKAISATYFIPFNLWLLFCPLKCVFTGFEAYIFKINSNT